MTCKRKKKEKEKEKKRGFEHIIMHKMHGHDIMEMVHGSTYYNAIMQVMH